jgi:hypothetical protein
MVNKKVNGSGISTETQADFREAVRAKVVEALLERFEDRRTVEILDALEARSFDVYILKHPGCE